MKIKILLADDHPLICQGIKSVLQKEEDIYITKEVARCDEIIKAVEETKPDILLLNLSMISIMDKHIIKSLCEGYSNSCKIIVLSEDANSSSLDTLLNWGVAGYLSKCDSALFLKDAIRKVLLQGKYLPNGGKIAKNKKIREKKSVLTEREMDIIRLLAEGMKNNEIAKRLFLSEKTVKNHLTNIFKKLKLNDRTQVLIYAIKNNLVFLS